MMLEMQHPRSCQYLWSYVALLLENIVGLGYVIQFLNSILGNFKNFDIHDVPH